MRLAIDVSNYTPIPSPSTVSCLRADGYELAIVGASYGTVARNQLQAFSDGGMAIEAYAWVSFGGGWERRIDRALAVIEGLPVKRLWLDCEEDPGGLSIAEIIERIQHARIRIAAYGSGIYTGGWWWNAHLPGVTDFGGMPLWTAEYRDPTHADPTLYGGWTEAAIWQYAGSVDTCGLNSDRNVILETEDEPMTEAERKEFNDLKATVFGQAVLNNDRDAANKKKHDGQDVIMVDHALRLNALEAKGK